MWIDMQRKTILYSEHVSGLYNITDTSTNTGQEEVMSKAHPRPTIIYFLVDLFEPSIPQALFVLHSSRGTWSPGQLNHIIS